MDAASVSKEPVPPCNFDPFLLELGISNKWGNTLIKEDPVLFEPPSQRRHSRNVKQSHARQISSFSSLHFRANEYSQVQDVCTQTATLRETQLGTHPRV